MEIIRLSIDSCLTVNLGKSGENLARKIIFEDPDEWAKDYGPGTVQLLHQRPGEDTPYPVVIAAEADGSYSWAVTAADTALAGQGKCELQYLSGDTVVKSRTWSTVVNDALVEPSEAPPEAQQGWVDKVLQAGTDAQEAADRAEAAALRQPYPNEETGTWWVWDANTEAYKDTGISYGGTSDHTKLTGRNEADQHPMSAITGLDGALEGKQPKGNYLTDKDIDTTLAEALKAADAAAVGERLSALSEEIKNIPDGSGLSTNAKKLLIEILQNAVYTNNMSVKIESLKEALASGDSGGGTGGEETITDEITVSDGVMTIVSVGSEITVSDGVMAIA